MGVIHTFPGLPPARASRIAAQLLNKHSPREIADAIEMLIDVLDLIGPVDEDNGDLRTVADGLPGDSADAEPDDKGDQAWVEWHTMRGSQKKGPNILAGHEDDEEDDAPEEDDPSGQMDEDGINTGRSLAVGPGCLISDNDSNWQAACAFRFNDD